MNDREQTTLISPWKIILQVIFWLLGLALLAWVIKGAFDRGGGLDMWNRIRAAPTLMLAGLLGCTLASAVFNGTAFWLTIQPIRAVRWRDMQLINVFANMLNYAPVRLGAIVRIAYNLRVDRLSLVQIGGWFALIAYVLFLGMASALTATLVRDKIDWIWWGILIAQMVAGGLALRFVASIPFVRRRALGLEQMALYHRGVWGAIALRVVDLAAYVGRMGCAMAILGLHLPWSQVVVLAVVALAASLTPLGRVGFREFCVAAAASRLNLDKGTISSAFDQLALLDSAGEVLVFVPLGIAAIPWFRKRWKNAARASTATADSADSKRR